MGIRIISGKLKGKKILTLPGKEVRPTADRIRESIFNILGNDLRNAVVLDLYAGTGAFGIEALSRGAKFAAFVDINKKVLEIIKKNIRDCNLVGDSQTILWDIAKSLDFLKSTPRMFDLVFLDPPYGQNLIPATLDHLWRQEKLGKNARIIAEHAVRDPLPLGMAGYGIVDQRKYGKTVISFLIYDPSDTERILGR
jgi:16S rRNA (guanine966-N2)-methyltransferase